ncbi:hypothetical protein [Amycolatopsis sp. WGS_07]|uniref:hypothetical protein n=1 Tax=Amycolatopsis sp. WGS_07 TaxID=3076764 RepID=UPI003872BA7C
MTSELLAFLHELRETTAWTVVSRSPSRWELAGQTWQATVTVDPRRWLGLEFAARDPVTGKRATYAIDTDLYDLSQEKYREFATEIERDIIEFLGNLRTGAMVRGNDGAKFVLVFPLDGSWVRVVQGRFMTSASTHSDRPAGGDWVPVE